MITAVEIEKSAHNVAAAVSIKWSHTMAHVLYKGFEIRPAPHELQGSGEWTLHLYITKHHGSQTAEKPFNAANTFATKAEAERHCIEFGKQIIDGKIPNCTTDDL